jgi:hypothetical protein
VIVAGLVLYGQLARFSAAYGLIALPVFWVAGALLVRRLPMWGIAAAALLVAWPVVADQMPDRLLDRWDARPKTEQREAIRGLNRIPLKDDGSAESMAALIGVWKQLGFDGRPTLSIGLRNDLTWVNDAIVGFLLDAPPAAWPMAYDPGLANQDKVQREVVGDLCRNRAPVVQLEYVHPYPPTANGWIGSRRLDEFLAVNYRVRAVAGLYRILVPVTTRCVMPDSLSGAVLAQMRDAAIERGELSAAGALSIARNRRSIDPDDTAAAALGGYIPGEDEVPPGPLGTSIRSLVDNRPRPGLARAASLRWPSDIQALAAQTAWVRQRDPGDTGDRAAVARVTALALARPKWAQAIANARTVAPSPSLVRRLERAGARGVPDFDLWRRDAAIQAGDAKEALRAGLDLVADFDRTHNPVRAGHAEIELTAAPGLEPGCVLILRRHADARPGVWAPTAPGPAVCTSPAIARLAVVPE